MNQTKKSNDFILEEIIGHETVDNRVEDSRGVAKDLRPPVESEGLIIS